MDAADSADSRSLEDTQPITIMGGGADVPESGHPERSSTFWAAPDDDAPLP
ncbi:hypothetical protein [Glaciihabitans sp. dw_435]|uniref:hypothetical protein n=1 Tax=Glaciihabitans sp. dw_435 TaxID=2720081 RepID=UPI001BD4B3DD|nr:hypothetical protein [Glaciihabitans sp. dw_435]